MSLLINGPEFCRIVNIFSLQELGMTGLQMDHVASLAVQEKELKKEYVKTWMENFGLM